MASRVAAQNYRKSNTFVTSPPDLPSSVARVVGAATLLMHVAGPKTLCIRGRTIWIVDAHRDDGKRFVVGADATKSLDSFEAP